MTLDVYCPECGEPWDTDAIHDRVSELHTDRPWYGPPIVDGRATFSQAVYERYYRPQAAAFRSTGCEALGASHSDRDPVRADAARTIYDLYGDDFDGAAVEFDNLGF